MRLSDEASSKVARLRQAALAAADELWLGEGDRAHLLASRLFVGDEALGWSSHDDPVRVVSAQRPEVQGRQPAPLAARLDAAHGLGMLLDQLNRGEQEQPANGRPQKPGHGEASTRKTRGSYFTPPALTRRVVEQAIEPLERLARPRSDLVVLDPAVGGGAFLLEAAALLQMHPTKAPLPALAPGWLQRFLGVDRSELALAVADAALRLAFGVVAGSPTLLLGDSLVDDLSLPDQVDWLVSNPPWVAFQGRAAAPLEASRRAYFRARYRSFHGYPTLQGMFVERATELCPQGVITLLLPSSVADLDGYRGARSSLTKTHLPLAPLEEFGQDAFEGVVQPCFALVAEPRTFTESSLPDSGSAAPFRLRERSRHGELSQALDMPACLERVRQLSPLPKHVFRELGFQSNRLVTAELLTRAPGTASGAAPHWVPLLEGKNVREFVVEEPRLWLDARPEGLARAQVRLRPPSAYQEVAFVLRQTASFPIAALHSGLPFRNSLLAGFGDEQLSPALLVGLLNSTLYRALFVAMTRDARQAVFPQIKINMLRTLPAPPHNPTLWRELEELVMRLTALARGERGQATSEKARVEEEQRRCRSELDRVVMELFELGPIEQAEIGGFFELRTARKSSRASRHSSAPLGPGRTGSRG